MACLYSFVWGVVACLLDSVCRRLIALSIIAATLLCPPISQNLNYSRLLADDSDNLDSEEELKDWLVQALRHSRE